MRIHTTECYSPIRRNEVRIHAMDEPQKIFCEGGKASQERPLTVLFHSHERPRKGQTLLVGETGE